MSNFADNIIDQNGQQVYLEDKHLNDQTLKTAVDTTDAVMLKDTNGEYHSIAKASFKEAVRAAMGSILTNFDKGSSITRIPSIDSNNDLGSVAVSNLASVLGEKNLIKIYQKKPSGVKPYIVFNLTSFGSANYSVYDLYGFNTNYSLFNLHLFIANWNTLLLKVNGNLTHTQGTAKFYSLSSGNEKKIIMDTGFSTIYSIICVKKLLGIDIPISVTETLPEGATEMTGV